MSPTRFHCSRETNFCHLGLSVCCKLGREAITICGSGQKGMRGKLNVRTQAVHSACIYFESVLKLQWANFNSCNTVKTITTIGPAHQERDSIFVGYLLHLLSASVV